MKLIQRHDAQKELYIFICIYAGWSLVIRIVWRFHQIFVVEVVWLPRRHDISCLYCTSYIPNTYRGVLYLTLVCQCKWYSIVLPAPDIYAVGFDYDDNKVREEREKETAFSSPSLSIYKQFSRRWFAYTISFNLCKLKPSVYDMVTLFFFYSPD